MAAAVRLEPYASIAYSYVQLLTTLAEVCLFCVDDSHERLRSGAPGVISMQALCCSRQLLQSLRCYALWFVQHSTVLQRNTVAHVAAVLKAGCALPKELAPPAIKLPTLAKVQKGVNPTEHSKRAAACAYCMRW